jgi:hypothetical protein
MCPAHIGHFIVHCNMFAALHQSGGINRLGTKARHAAPRGGRAKVKALTTKR